ncbi:MAG: peptidylprolyl isomerase [Pseudomonadales bacterium]|nr:peptidylprolyl isomerase [Pseudomonadales bacterium]
MLCAQFAQASDPLLIMKTSLGEVWIQLNPGKAPVTVEHFLSYVDDNYYDGVIFHRVIPGFMIQAGGYAADMQAKETQGTIVNEAHNGLKNLIGTLSMARTSDPDSADAQFFINTSNNSSLDKSHSNPGYAVFGKVIQGMSVVGEIELVDTGIKNSMAAVPVEPVVIISLRRAD